MRVHPVIYFFVKNITRLVLVLLFAGIPTAMYFLRVHGIGFGAKEALGEALSSPTVAVHIGRLALDPFSGLLARDVVVQERGNATRVLASINRISISLNMSELMHRRVVVDTLLLNKANAAIPVGPTPEAPLVTLEDIHSEIIVLGDRLHVSVLKATVQGIRIQITGEVLNPLAYPPPPAPQPSQAEPPPDFSALVNQITSVLNETTFPDGSPLVRANFEWDAARPESLSVPRFSLTCGRVSYRDINIKNIEISGEYEKNHLRVPVLHLSDETGRLQASGEWTPTDGKGRASLISSLDPVPFFKTFLSTNKPLAALVFSAPPQLEADIQADLGHASVSVIGSLLAPGITYKGLAFRDMGASFAWADGQLYVRDITLAARRGELQANVWVAPDDLRLQARITIPPSDLASLFDPQTREFLAQMEFVETPDISISLRAPKLDFAALKGTGHLKLGRTAMRGAWIDKAESSFEIADRCFTYKNFVVVTGPGKGTGSFAYDIARQEVRLDNIHSTLIPCDVLMWIDPKIAATVAPYRFRSNPTVAVQGKVHMRLAAKNNLAIRIDSPVGMTYDLLGRTLVFGHTSAKVDLIGNKVNAFVSRAPIMDGEATVKAIVSIDPATPDFSADVNLSRVNFSKLTGLYFDYDDSKGVVTGQYKFQARMGQESLMTGQGSLRVEEGNVFAIPMFGPFSTILGSILPKFAYNTARLATVDFTVANKKITTHNLEIIGRGFSMFGDGDIYFLTGGLAMSMRINAQGIPGIVFFPMSKLLEYYSEGTISRPQWSPKIIPSIPTFGGSGAKKPADR